MLSHWRLLQAPPFLRAPKRRCLQLLVALHTVTAAHHRSAPDQESARVIRAGINQPTAAARHAARPGPGDLGRPACDAAVVATHVTQHRTVLRTGHPGYPAVQLRLNCDQIRVVECKIRRQGKKEKWKISGTMSTCAIIGNQPALDFRRNLCMIAHTISKC